MSETQLLERHAELRQCVSTDAAARGSVVPGGTIPGSEKTHAAQDVVSLAWGDEHYSQRPHPGSLPRSTLPTEPARRSFVSGSDGSLSASVTPSGVGGSVPTAPAGGRLGIYTKSSTPPLHC